MGILNLEEQIPRRLHPEDADGVHSMVDNRPRLLPDQIHAAQQKLLELETKWSVYRTISGDPVYYNFLSKNQSLTHHTQNRQK